MRTQKEIDELRSLLKAEKDRLPRYSSFGEDNWEGYAAMFDVLDGKYTDFDDLESHESAMTRDAFSAARDAIEWLEGNIETSDLV